MRNATLTRYIVSGHIFLLSFFQVDAIRAADKTVLSTVHQRQLITISQQQYSEKLRGFWLGQNIANWTGLITEMDKIGTPETLPFYTDDDWGTVDLPAMWGETVPHADTIDFYFESKGTPWGADDDTDIEYMYAHLHHHHKTTKLTAEQIRDGWLKHTYSEEDAPLFKKFPNSKPSRENFLWVSNQRARDLMAQGAIPPATSEPETNPYHMMIDAQLTTELFGLLAPTRVDVALDIAELPIRTTASGDAAWIAQFYVAMHALASLPGATQDKMPRVEWLAEQASHYLPTDSTPAKMYQFVKSHYHSNADKNDWESTRDAVYHRYQINQQDGYVYRQPFDAGINFAASLVSLFYGQGDIVRTIKIGTLSGWDSDNPTATWGGLLGFIIGHQAVIEAFEQPNLSDTYWIHRTRREFPDHTPNISGEDNFTLMAAREIATIDRIVVEKMGGSLDKRHKHWYWVIPKGTSNVHSASTTD
jgi:hypothetical protein